MATVKSLKAFESSTGDNEETIRMNATWEDPKVHITVYVISILSDPPRTVIVKKSFPKSLSADCRPTVDRQSADS